MKYRKKKQTGRLCGEAVGRVVESSSWWLHMYWGKHMALHALRPAVKLAVTGTAEQWEFTASETKDNPGTENEDKHRDKERQTTSCVPACVVETGGIHMTWMTMMTYQVKQIMTQ